ncbi:MAG: 4Fe-4S dicluster domain-containing protein [Candidatus Omnitrophica bacterium]|nr:4Fe-4S dicluster domain-containing protein [Candidatus Omnitrophota bacterium]
MKGILTDITKCVGCGKCVDGCTAANDLPPGSVKQYQTRDGLSGERFTSVLHVDKNGQNRFVRKQCRHCLEPACASACIVGALHTTETGAVVYEEGKCIGCRYCMMACPFGIPRYEWAEAIPYVRKCSLCYERIKQGGAPACVEACPEKATIFGERDELLAIAKDRIDKHPDQYIGKVFGEKEIGGTSVMYISDIPLDFLAWKPDLGDNPLPQYTWAALNKVPGVALGMAAAMTGIYWIIERRMKLQEEQEESNA